MLLNLGNPGLYRNCSLLRRQTRIDTQLIIVVANNQRDPNAVLPFPQPYQVGSEGTFDRSSFSRLHVRDPGSGARAMKGLTMFQALGTPLNIVAHLNGVNLEWLQETKLASLWSLDALLPQKLVTIHYGVVVAMAQGEDIEELNWHDE